jgi:tRNA nucleotidyltransferase/poly(A) polymerase
VSVPRVDSKSTGDGHRDFEIELGKHITLQQDQLRRDFFMNAIAKDVDYS